ncbi:MAG: FHA domain-containing protein [Chloroflexota bacterium]
MIICGNCKYRNREGYLFCEDCGFPLDANARDRTSTRQFDEQDDPILSAKATWGTARLSSESEIFLHLDESREPLKLNVLGRSVVGREDASTHNHPDIDLVPFGGLEKGVSRVHAIFERSEGTLTIVDMGSSNGTQLNGQKLMPNQPRVLRDGDEIRFGKLVARVYFK